MDQPRANQRAIRPASRTSAPATRSPDCTPDWRAISATGGLQTENAGRFFISLKPRKERTSSADEVIRRLRRETASTGRLVAA